MKPQADKAWNTKELARHRAEVNAAHGNRCPTPALLQEIANLKRDLSEPACRARAERMAQQASDDGRAAIVQRIRARRANKIESSPIE